MVSGNLSQVDDRSDEESDSVPDFRISEDEMEMSVPEPEILKPMFSEMKVSNALSLVADYSSDSGKESFLCHVL